MGCCRDMAKNFVIGISVIVAIVGIVIMSLSAVVINEIGGELNEVGMNSPAITSIIFGLFMFLFGFFGCYGASANNKICLIIFSCATTFCTLIILAFGIVVLVQSGELENVAEFEEPATGVENDFQTFILAVGGVCCELVNDDDFEDDDKAEQVADALLDILDCEARNDNQPCVAEVNEDLFGDIVDFLDDGDSNAGTCQLLQEVNVDVNGVELPLINADDPGVADVCAEGNGNNVDLFVSEATLFIEENFRVIGIANLVTGVILLLLQIFSCVLIFTNDDEDENK